MLYLNFSDILELKKNQRQKHRFVQASKPLPHVLHPGKEEGRKERKGWVIKTNLQNKSLISADRGTKTTLTLTILRSYLSRIQRICLLQYLNLSSAKQSMPYSVVILAAPESAAISTHDNIRRSDISRFSSMDSGLEAFSRNPTHGSFSALTFQSTEFAKYANRRFLSY